MKFPFVGQEIFVKFSWNVCFEICILDWNKGVVFFSCYDLHFEVYLGK